MIKTKIVSEKKGVLFETIENIPDSLETSKNYKLIKVELAESQDIATYIEEVRNFLLWINFNISSTEVYKIHAIHQLRNPKFCNKPEIIKFVKELIKKKSISLDDLDKCKQTFSEHW